MNNTTSNLPPTPSPSSDPRPHAVVIGAGFGGLAAAVRLGARGYRVTVLEHRDAPGGRAYVYERDGFSFDGGPTVITAPFLFEELWELAGKKLSDDVEMRPVDPFYRIRFHDGQTFDYTGDAERMKAEVARFSPRDVEGYERFVQMSERIFRIGFQELAHVDFSSWWDMAKIVPDMMRLQSFKTVWSLVADHVKDDRLRQVLSFHPLLVGGNPFDTTSIYSLIAFLERQWGVHYPKGGTASLVRGLVKLVEGQGGSFRYGATVKRIRTEGRRATGVELENGEVFDAAVVVSNADSSETYRKLIDPESRSRWTDKKIERARHSMSLFVWYFGTDRKYEDVAHHTILLGPRYRGLLDDIFTNKVLSEDFSLYLHRPTATDTSIAPPGCEAFYVLSPVPNLEGKTDWASEAEPYRKRIESFLSKTVLPGLEGHIVSQHVSTPLYFRDTLLSYRGAAFGLEPVLTQSAYFRPHNKSEELDNLFLVGAGTHPGAGVPGVLSSARVLDRLVPDARR